MNHAPIGNTGRIDVPEQQGVPLSPLVLPGQAWKIRFPALVIVIEIKKERRNALPPLLQVLQIARFGWVQKIYMWLELLA